jgi:hypothetical protein
MCCRLPYLKHFAAAILLALACIAPVRADDLDDFNRAVEAAMSHHRVAAGYLRTGNIDLAALELEGLREAWGKVTSLPKPAAFRDTERYTSTMLDISTRLVGVVLVLDLGAVDVARKSLDTIRASLSALRRASGVTVLADCVIDSNTAMDTLFAHDARPDWASCQAVPTPTAPCCSAVTAWRRPRSAPRRIPPPDRRRAREPRAGPKAIETRDGELLHRLLIELRSFDHLLAFRYG